MKITIDQLNNKFQYDVTISGKKYTLGNVIDNEIVEANTIKGQLMIQKFYQKSNNRIEPPCPIYQKCGGCSLLHMKYDYQLLLKTRYVEELFKPLKLNNKVKPIIGMADPSHYRNKNQVVFGYNNKRQVVSGFYQSATHNIIDYQKCYVQDEYADEIIQTIKELMAKMHILPYDEDRHIGLIRHVMVKRSRALDETMVIIVTATENFPGRQNFIKALLARHKINTIVQSVNPKDTTFVLGNKSIILFGKGYISDILCEMKFIISPNSFYQINPLQTKVLYETALNMANLKSTDILLDAYCGVGTIGLIASTKVSKVIGVELEKSAVQDAIINAKNNNVKNIHFYCDDATNFIQNLANKKEHIDVIVLDPPRKGSDARFLNAVMRLHPTKIIYISCNPETQVRDLKLLLDSYQVQDIQPVDMFPNTEHVETVVLLSKEK